MNPIRLAIICLLLTIFLGCGAKAPYGVVPIEGTATWEGKPIPTSFMLKFRPEGGLVESIGAIKDGGAFKAIHTVDIVGVPVGNCTVRVYWSGGDGTKPPTEFEPLLKKYGHSSEGLPLEIKKADKKMKIDFPAAS